MSLSSKFEDASGNSGSFLRKLVAMGMLFYGAATQANDEKRQDDNSAPVAQKITKTHSPAERQKMFKVKQYSDLIKVLCVICKETEGTYPYAYLCKNKVLTAGTGIAKSNTEFKNLKWLDATTKKTVSPERLEKYLEEVVRKGQNHPSSFAKRLKFYEQIARKHNIVLSAPEADKALLKAVVAAYRETKGRLARQGVQLEELPFATQLRTVGLAFQLGSYKLVSTFENFMEALQHKDWKRAAKEGELGNNTNDTLKSWRLYLGIFERNLAKNKLPSAKELNSYKNLSFLKQEIKGIGCIGQICKKYAVHDLQEQITGRRPNQQQGR